MIDGLSIRNSSLEIKRRIGVLPEDLALFDSLTIWEHLKLCGPIYGLSAQETEARAEQLLNYLDLWPDRHTPVEQSSFGMKKKCALAMALIHNPKVLFLDEPFEGIDPVASRSIKDLLVQSGSLVDIIIGLIVASTPAAVIVYGFAVEDGSVAWKLAGLTLLWLALYLLSLSRSARVLETRPRADPPRPFLK